MSPPEFQRAENDSADRDCLVLVYLLSRRRESEGYTRTGASIRSRRQEHVKMNSYYVQLVSGRRATTRAAVAVGPALRLRQVVGLPLRRAGVSSRDPAGRATRKVAARGPGSTATTATADGDGSMHAWQSRELTGELAAKRHGRRHDIDHHRACRHAAGTVTFLKTTPFFYSSSSTIDLCTRRPVYQSIHPPQ